MLAGAAASRRPPCTCGGGRRRPPRSGAGNRSRARTDNPILANRFGGKDRNCRSSCAVRDEESRSDVWEAGARLCAPAAKGRAVRGRGGGENRRQGRRRWTGGAFAPVPAPEGLALAAFLKVASETGGSLGSCRAEGVAGPRQPWGQKDREHRFGRRDARRLLCRRLRVSVPPCLIRKAENVALERRFPVAPSGAVRAPAAAAVLSPPVPTGRHRFSGAPRSVPARRHRPAERQRRRLF